jgi:hypothetical protein
MDEEKAMLQLANIQLQMEVAQVRLALSTARQIIKNQAQKIRELEGSFNSGIKVENGDFYA